MKILIATPLYPPDVARPAPFVKELAKRLQKDHEVTVLTYGAIPETVDRVKIITVPRHYPLPLRLVLFTARLFWHAFRANALYVLNGPSVELPVNLAAFFLKRRLIFQIGDNRAHEYAQKHPLRRLLEGMVIRNAHTTFTALPLERPEIFPLEAYPEKQFELYEHSWGTHLQRIMTTLHE